MGSFSVRTTIRAGRAACFDLSLSVDAHTSSMAASGERAVAGTTTGIMGPGDVVTWRARHFGVPIRMTSRITEHDRPTRFVDEQVSGPFARWWHEHTFAESPGGTEMIDTVRYRAPFGLLGAAVERAGLDRYMRSLIETRNAWLKATLEGAA
jgi:ligand-binding SRPBCC domain-containing protein